MKRIYLDNGATSFPKAPGVAEAMMHYMTALGTNVGRGAYAEAFEAQRAILELREAFCRFFEAEAPEQVVFTSNVTESLNVIIKGLLAPGDHVLISPLEHNAVLRPLHQLTEQGVSYGFLPADPLGKVDVTALAALDPDVVNATKLVICTHASNVFGTVNDLEAIGTWCKDHDLYFAVDVAQTAGVLPVSMVKCHADAVAFTGHKGLLGPPGTGGMCLSKRLSDVLKPLILGGTGSHSESECQPELMPDKFESGTPNTVGLYGLQAGLAYVESLGLEAIHRHEMVLVAALIAGIEALDAKYGGIRVVGPGPQALRTGVVAIAFKDFDPSEVSFYMEKHYGIASRVGLHCAPLAHKHLGTFPEGTLRLSVSIFNSLADIEAALEAIDEVIYQLKQV